MRWVEERKQGVGFCFLVFNLFFFLFLNNLSNIKSPTSRQNQSFVYIIAKVEIHVRHKSIKIQERKKKEKKDYT